MEVRATVIFRGRVQGVNFRAYCADRADALGLHGYVRNLPDGAVEAVFEGDRPGIEACIEWNKSSQPNARVDSVEVTWAEPEGGFRGFHIRH
jgi:acylphosphatase